MPERSLGSVLMVSLGQRWAHVLLSPLFSPRGQDQPLFPATVPPSVEKGHLLDVFLGTTSPEGQKQLGGLKRTLLEPDCPCVSRVPAPTVHCNLATYLTPQCLLHLWGAKGYDSRRLTGLSCEDVLGE